ncbi:MAG: response regulator [Candidatus Zixiibacteriota bacterium]
MEPLDQNVSLAAKRRTGRSRPVGQGASILVVDDDQSICDVLSDILATAGHRITKCLDGHSALEVIGRSQFDLVITDLGMPGMSGLELAELIHAAIPDLPVVLVTALGSQFTDADVVRGGIAAVLDKPFHFHQLHDTVNKALKVVA